MTRSFVSSICFTLFFVISLYAETIGGKYVMEFDLSAHDNSKEVQLWIPYPVSNSHQSISDISVTGSYTECAVYTDNKYEIPMLYAKWDKGSAARKMIFTYKVARKEIQYKNLPQKEAAWNKKDFEKYLEGSKLLVIDGETKKLADSIIKKIKGKKTVLSKARAIYDWCCENTWRNPETIGCGKGDVCELLKNPSGKCADISSIFIALCRAVGVPARDIFGIRQGKEDKQNITKWQHCWAEFFLPGFGWVPVDPADVRKMMLKNNLKLNDKKTDALIENYWAGLDPFRTKLSTGRDIILNPRQHGEPLNYFMYPLAQVGTETIDFLDPEKFKYTITYSKL